MKQTNKNYYAPILFIHRYVPYPLTHTGEEGGVLPSIRARGDGEWRRGKEDGGSGSGGRGIGGFGVIEGGQGQKAAERREGNKLVK